MDGEVEEPSAYLNRHGIEDASLLQSLKAAQQLVVDGRVVEEEQIANQRLGDYRLVSKLGKGGMGIVFLAEQVSLHRLIALKVIRPDMQASANAKERFIREARAVARLRHPHIVTVFDFGEDRGMLYIAMELVPGRGLNDLLEEAEARGDRVGPEQILAWLVPIARAVHMAHEQGIIHRDIKPSNILISREGHPVLLDFGLARENLSEQSTITMSFIGTPAYASPEQLVPGDKKIDRRTDIYSLGVCLYRCLAGQLPFEIKLSAESIERFLRSEAPPLRSLRPDLTRELEHVVHRALAKEPEDRYANAGELADDMQALLERRPISDAASGELRWADALEKAVPGLCVRAFLGPGSHGKLFRGRFPGQAEPVLIKLMDSWVAERASERFLVEAAKAAQVEHPHIARVLNHGLAGECCFVVSELHQGRSLQELVEAQGPLPLEEALRLVRRIGLGLDAMHAAGVVHRDVKPAHIFVQLDDGDVMLMEPGLSAELSHGQESGQAQTGLGSPALMAPEVCLGRAAEAASDQYALAVTLCFLLTGHYPFSDPSPLALLQMHIHKRPPALPAAVAPRHVSRAVARALEKKPAARFPGVLAFVQALEAPASRQFPLAPQMGLLVLAIFALAAVALGLVALALSWYL